jgi:hypothetical protein
MILSIAFTIFSNSNSPFCRVWGTVDLPDVPNVGDEINFAIPSHSVPLPQTSFVGVVQVDAKTYLIGRSPAVHLNLRPIVAASCEEAKLIEMYFCAAHDFKSDA